MSSISLSLLEAYDFGNNFLQALIVNIFLFCFSVCKPLFYYRGFGIWILIACQGKLHLIGNKFPAVARLHIFEIDLAKLDPVFRMTLNTIQQFFDGRQLHIVLLTAHKSYEHLIRQTKVLLTNT